MPRRPQVDDLRGSAEVRPAARPSDNVFVSGSPRILNFDDVDFSQFLSTPITWFPLRVR